MSSTTISLRLPRAVPVAAVVAAFALALVAAGTSGDRAAHAAMPHLTASPASMNASQLRFHDHMRKLWEDHVTWTRLAIVSFAADLPDFDRTRRGCCATRRTSATQSSPTTVGVPATA